MKQPSDAHSLLHHPVLIDAELGGVHAGKVGQGEGPAVQASGEADGALLGVHLHAREEAVRVCACACMRNAMYVCETNM